MRLERTRFQFGMELQPDETGVILVFDDLRQHAVGREARESQAVLLEAVLVGGIDLVAMAMALRNLGGAAIDVGHPATALEHRRVGAKTHGAAEITGLRSLLQFIAAQPFRHQADQGFRRRAELGGIGLLDADQIARGLDRRHLHAEADAEIGYVALARELRRADLALGAALPETA